MRAVIYVLIGLLMIVLGAYNLYGGYELESPGYSAFGFGFIIIGAIMTLFGISMRKGNSTEKPLEDIVSVKRASHMPDENRPNDNGEVEIRALVQAMGVVAVADKRVRPEEIETIAHIYEEMLGLKISHQEIREILSEFDDHFDFEEILERNRSRISPTMKRSIIECCRKVMVSDLEIVRSEENRIMEIGRALGFTDPQIENIIAAMDTP